MAKKLKKEGICKLTQKRGRFVDSHLIPKALTRADGLGPGLVQQGHGRTERRFSSWYDSALVTEEGERILSDYDDQAIRTLRSHQMVWSGWGPAQTLSGVNVFPGTAMGLRIVEFTDRQVARDLRLFFLSILWRAAATDRREFVEVELPHDHLEQLRRMVLEGTPEPFAFYPISLVQLSTLGERHNHSPLADLKKIPAIGDSEGYEEPIYRFYFDGLIAHFSRLTIEENMKRDLSWARIGEQATLHITTTTYEASRQAANLAFVRVEAELGRPLSETEAATIWPAAGFVDTEIGCFMKPEVAYAATEVWT